MKYALLAVTLAVVVLGPLALRPRQDRAARPGERTLVIITPHNEAIRSEFGHGFEAAHFARTGERIRVDWRTPGGTSEIGRYLAGEYVAGFQNYWENTLGKKWTGTIEKAFANSKIIPDDTAADDTPEQAARRAFLASNVSCRIDLFFGGGAYDYNTQAAAGRLVSSGVVESLPGVFGPGGIPQSLGGEPFWDPKGRWVGTCLGAFGICYNTDALRRIGVQQVPRKWSDLADPRYLHEVALANPTQSASVNRAFEMLIQEQMQVAIAKAQGTQAGVPISPSDESAALAEGWANAMRLLQRIGANARYFTDASSKIALDVTAGEAAAGMTIDFYGRFQSESVREPDGSSRIQYADAEAGSSSGADPVGMLRGAPQPDLARAFIEWTVSAEGQKLWNWKVGTPGGPVRYALRRLPILPSLYSGEFTKFRSDPDVNPYLAAGSFTYQEKWTGPLFATSAFIVRVMCIDPHEELTHAWKAILAAGSPPEAVAAFHDVAPVSYSAASSRIRETLRSDKIKEVQLAKELADHFRSQYRRATELARAGR